MVLGAMGLICIAFLAPAGSNFLNWCRSCFANSKSIQIQSMIICTRIKGWIQCSRFLMVYAQFRGLTDVCSQPQWWLLIFRMEILIQFAWITRLGWYNYDSWRKWQWQLLAISIFRFLANRDALMYYFVNLLRTWLDVSERKSAILRI